MHFPWAEKRRLTGKIRAVFRRLTGKKRAVLFLQKTVLQTLENGQKSPNMCGRLRWRACFGLCFRIVCDQKSLCVCKDAIHWYMQDCTFINSLRADRCQGYDPRGVKETNWTAQLHENTSHMLTGRLSRWPPHSQEHVVEGPKLITHNGRNWL